MKLSITDPSYRPTTSRPMLIVELSDNPAINRLTALEVIEDHMVFPQEPQLPWAAPQLFGVTYSSPSPMAVICEALSSRVHRPCPRSRIYRYSAPSHSQYSF